MRKINREQITQVLLEKSSPSRIVKKMVKPWIFWGSPKEKFCLDSFEVGLGDYNYVKDGIVYEKACVRMEMSNGRTPFRYFDSDEQAETYFKDLTNDRKFITP